MRFLNMLYAKLFGYFWLPCPVCQKMFGGHEIVNSFRTPLVTIGDDGFQHAFCVCSEECSERAEERNRANGFNYPSRLKRARLA